MGKPASEGGAGGWPGALLIVGLLGLLGAARAQEYGCPPQEKILPCRCSTRAMEFQIWCSHSELPRVLEGLKAVSRYVSQPVDELILENNNLPSLPGQVFASLRVLRLMLRNNRLERVSSGWLEGLHDSLLELFLVEPELRSLPADSLENLQGLEAVTLQSKLIKRLPSFSGLSKLRYLQINSPGLLELSPRHFRDLGTLEQLHVFGSPRLGRLEAGLLRGLPRLQLLNVSDCGLHWIHPRALVDLPELREVALVENAIEDATMLGRALLDLPALAVLQVDGNRVGRIAEGAIVDLIHLARLSFSRNRITELLPGALQRLPHLRTLDLSQNRLRRVHPDFFPGGGRLEEVRLTNNELEDARELRALLEGLPRLKFLEASRNRLVELRYGTLRGHASLERLHLDHNHLGLLEREAFGNMPALRELRLRNNSLEDSAEAPFWDLPALKGLDLGANLFRRVEARLLANLPSLRRLDISDNSLSLVEADAFRGTPALEHLNLSGNALPALHPLSLRPLLGLYELDLSWNRLLEVPPGLPRSLERLRLLMNRITVLPSGPSGALSLPLLRALDLGANGLERLAPGALAGLPALRELDLGFNGLTVLEEAALEGLERLERLDLRYNRLSQLRPGSVQGLRALLDLCLRGNRLESLAADLLAGNPRLQRLDISRNNLGQLSHATFAGTRELRELLASDNALGELPSSLQGLGSLEFLDLGHNRLTALGPETLGSLGGLLELKLARNRIRELREGAFERLPRLALVDLEDNDLALVERNAVRGLPELQALRLGRNRIQAIPSGAFAELPMLQSAELQENRIQEIGPDAFINVPHLLFLNLSGNLLGSLERLGLESLRSLEVLDLSDNRIQRVSGESLASMEWLVELKLDGNRICAIQGAPFDEMPRLRVLSLRNNRMASVAEAAFKRLRSNIAVLDIEGNPLSCSCGMLWLRGWLQQASAEGPRCADGSLFREVRLSKQDCQRERLLEPTQQLCEPDVQTTESKLAWIHGAAKGTSRLPPGIEADYEDYADYPQEVGANVSDLTSNAVGPSSAPAPAPSTLPARGKNASALMTLPTKKNPGIPPSPSSSGFTFFGVPLPSLNFNLWGNAGKKAERKEDSSGTPSSPAAGSSATSSRPGRGRYRNFPPTEPEIHRGGFVPLPRGQAGFMPIVDPRLANRSFTRENESGSQVSYERKNLKTANYTVGKVERTAAPLPAPKIPKGRKPLRPTQPSATIRVPTPTPSDRPSDEEALASSDIVGEGVRLRPGPRRPTERSLASPPATTAEPELVTTDTTPPTPISPPEPSPAPTPRAMEASALSALLVPGGQVQPPPARPPGRPSITKVQPSAHPEAAQAAEAQRTDKLLAKEDSHLSGSAPDEAVKLIEDADFNWYFQHYNDTDLEPYVAVVYGAGPSSGAKRPFLAFFLHAYCLLRYFL